MTLSRNTLSRSKIYKESLAIVPNTSPTSPSLSKYDIDNIKNDIKDMTAMTDKHHSDMKNLNEHISAMLTKIIEKVPRQTSKRNNSQIFYPYYQTMNTASKD